MYKFIFQTIEGMLPFDFSLTTLDAVKYHNWYTNEIEYTFMFCENIEDIEKVDDRFRTIPIGSVEFVLSYYKKFFGINNIVPVNIPNELLPFTNREVFFGDENTPRSKNLFVKSTDKIKGFVDLVFVKEVLPPGNYLFSEKIWIDSEWRCFVSKDELVSIHNYSNSLGMQPDINVINKMIEALKGKFEAYTLDVGVNETGTFVVEVHDFFSTGLYGFRDYRQLVKMTIASHNQRVRNIAKI